MNWKQIEMLGYAYYCGRGYRIHVPLVDNSHYDFIAEKDGHFLRVNVKMAGLKNKERKDSWSISLSHTIFEKGASYNVVDIYLAWIPSMLEFIELDGSFFDGSKSKSKRIPKEFLKSEVKQCKN